MSAIEELKQIAELVGDGTKLGGGKGQILEWIRKWIESASVESEYDIYYYRNYHKFEKFLDHINETSYKNLAIEACRLGATCVEKDTETKHHRTYRMFFLRREPKK